MAVDGYMIGVYYDSQLTGCVRFGVDTSAMFTDVVVLRSDGTRTPAKASTAGGYLAVGILNAVDEVARSMSRTPQELLGDTKLFRASCTTVTNALLTGRDIGSTELPIAAGFEDTLHIVDVTARDCLSADS